MKLSLIPPFSKLQHPRSVLSKLHCFWTALLMLIPACVVRGICWRKVQDLWGQVVHSLLGHLPCADSTLVFLRHYHSAFVWTLRTSVHPKSTFSYISYKSYYCYRPLHQTPSAHCPDLVKGQRHWSFQSVSLFLDLRSWKEYHKNGGHGCDMFIPTVGSGGKWREISTTRLPDSHLF